MFPYANFFLFCIIVGAPRDFCFNWKWSLNVSWLRTYIKRYFIFAEKEKEGTWNLAKRNKLRIYVQQTVRLSIYMAEFIAMGIIKHLVLRCFQSDQLL